jgi:predicted kinase
MPAYDPLVPRLISLNGPPAAGKSTLAKLYASTHPLSLNLDLDRVRDLIGQWQHNRSAAGILTRAICLAAAREHLTAGHDVIVPQMLAFPEYPTALAETATATGASFHEIFLYLPKEAALRRFAGRSDHAGHVEERELLAVSGGMTELAAMYDRLAAYVPTRPQAKVITSVEGDPSGTFQALLAALLAC